MRWRNNNSAAFGTGKLKKMRKRAFTEKFNLPSLLLYFKQISVKDDFNLERAETICF